MLNLFRKTAVALVIVLAGSTLGVAVSAIDTPVSQVPVASADGICKNSGGNQANMSIGLRGPRGSTPATFGPGTGGWQGTPMPTLTSYPCMMGPDVYDVICAVYDYIKNKCVAYKRKRTTTTTSLPNGTTTTTVQGVVTTTSTTNGTTTVTREQPYPVPSTTVVPNTSSFAIQSGYYGTPDLEQAYCHAWDYYFNLCVGWVPNTPPWAPQYPVINYIWTSPWNMQWVRSGWWADQKPTWLWDNDWLN